MGLADLKETYKRLESVLQELMGRMKQQLEGILRSWREVEII